MNRNYEFYVLSKTICRLQLADAKTQEEKEKYQKLLAEIEEKLKQLDAELEEEWFELTNKEC